MNAYCSTVHGVVVVGELDADHQAATAHVTDRRVTGAQPLEALAEIRARVAGRCS